MTFFFLFYNIYNLQMLHYADMERNIQHIDNSSSTYIWLDK